MKALKSLFTIFIGIILAICMVTEVTAQDFVYQPINPAFGGNPGNYGWLVNSANIQNLHEETAADRRLQRDPLQDFEQSLQRQVLSQLTRDLVRQQFGEEGRFQEGQFEFGEFTIDVSPGPDGVEVRIINILTGDETTVSIPSF